MKKLVALVLAVMLFTGVAASLAEELLPGYYTPPKMTEGQYPIKQEGVTLTYWAPFDGTAPKFISTLAENDGYIQAMADTGVTLEFTHPIQGSEIDQFNLMLNSGNLPDMIQMSGESWYNGGLRAMYEDGIIVDLTPYLDEYAPQYKEITEYNELGYAQMHADGKVLGFYKVTIADKIPYIRFNTNKAWIAEYGKSEPKTIEEYEAYFDWILANKEGVVPVFFNLDYDQAMNLTMGAFDLIYDWYLDKADGKTVKYWASSENYKSWLELMNKWYNKGYFHRDFASLTTADAQALFDGGKLACIADSVDATEGRVAGSFAVTNFPYMRQTADQVLGSNLPSNLVGDGGDYVTVITTACKNVEAAVQYLNYGYTFEGSLPFSFGIEGKAWNWGANGIPEFTDWVIDNPEMSPIDHCWVSHTHFATRYTYPDDITIPTGKGAVNSMAIRTLWADDKNEQNFLQMPPLSLTSDEASERADIMQQVNTYANEKKLQFITGAESLDNFDAYLAELNAMQLDRATEITQTATNRFYGIE